MTAGSRNCPRRRGRRSTCWTWRWRSSRIRASPARSSAAKRRTGLKLRSRRNRALSIVFRNDRLALLRETELKIAPALIFAASLAPLAPARAQDAPIKVDFAPLLATLHARDWVGVRENVLADAVRAAFAKGGIEAAPPGRDVLTLSAPDGAQKKNDEFMFTVVFSRDGDKLGEAVEYCAITKLADCTDQLILDTRTAAQ